jgi:hypothetical protein
VLRPCVICGTLSTETRCPTHQVNQSKLTKSTTARGYGNHHQILRKRWAKVVEAGDGYCARCGKWIPPGEPWDLGHDDTDRTKYRGPEHQACNRGAPNRAEVPRRQSREW